MKSLLIAKGASGFSFPTWVSRVATLLAVFHWPEEEFLMELESPAVLVSESGAQGHYSWVHLR